jgi:hypothetical protein
MGVAAPPAPGRCSAPALTVTITDAPGTLNPFGAASTTQSHCVTPPSLDFTDGIFTFTFASGGSFSGTYSGTLVPIAPPVSFGIIGTFIITGGTGNFAGATGGGSASGTQDFATGEFTLQLNGTVTAAALCQVCHKGHTLVVPCNTLEYRRHLDHGDAPNACAGTGKPRIPAH